ncbi:hypothetical protein [Sphingomonas sp. UYP23]
MSEKIRIVPWAAHNARIIYCGLTVDFIDEGYFCRIPIKDVAIDADGAPDAYGPPRFEGDLDGCGTDTLNHAGYPDNKHNSIPDDWRDILVSDAQDRPALGKGGFFISKTSLQDETVGDRVPGKFVDASRVSYIVMPRFWIDHLGVKLGDLCLLWHARLKIRTVAIVADTCPVDEPLGEMSIAAARNIGGRNVSPITGVDLPGNGRVLCCIFKNSRPDLVWPITDAFVQSFRGVLEARLAAVPG